MAYVYNQIEERLANGSDNDASKGTTITQDSGSVPSASSANSSPAASGKPTSEVNSNAALYNQAINANVGKTAAPAGAFQNFGNEIGQSQQKLQDSSQQFLHDTDQANQPAVDTDTLHQALTGNQDQKTSDAFTKIQSLFNTSNPSVGIYNPGDLSVPNIDQLNTDAGLKNIVSQGQNPRYTAGQASFDLAALEKSPDFMNQVEGLKKSSADLQNNITSLTNQTQQQAQTDAAAKLAAAQASARGYLTDERAGLSSDIQRKTDAANAALGGLDVNSVLQSNISQATPGIEASAVQKFGQRADPQFQQALANLQASGINPSDYVTKHNAYTTADFVNPDQAVTWNQINGLLGDNNPNYNAGAGQGNLSSFNTDALTNKLIGDTQNLRDTADVASKADIDKILGSATGLANGVNANSKDIGSYLAPTLTQYGNDVVNATPEYKSYWATPSLTGQPSPTDHLDIFNKYIQQLKTPINIPQVQNTDVISSDQATQLNKDSADLGLPANYQAGQYSAGTNPQSIVNKDDFSNWLKGYLSDQEIARVATGKEGPAAPGARTVYNSGTGSGGGEGGGSAGSNPNVNAIINNQGAYPTVGTFDSLNPALGQTAVVDPNAIHQYGPDTQAKVNQAITATSSPQFVFVDPNIGGQQVAPVDPTQHDQWSKIGSLLNDNSWINPIAIPTANRAVNFLRTGK